mgnify:CR=1 FL=1
MTTPKIVKHSFALGISPAQAQAISGRRLAAHDLIAEHVGILPSVSDIRLEGDEPQVLYDLPPQDANPEVHRHIAQAVSCATTQLVASGYRHPGAS